MVELDSEKVPKVGTSTDNGVTRFDGTSGLQQNSGVTIDDSNNVIIPGNLTVNGTTTTINATNVDVVDKNITIAKGGNDAAAEGAGLTVDRTSTDGSLVFDSTKTSKWKLGLVGSEVEVADISSSQTLTNKTLTAPAITSPTGIVKADVGLGNVDNTSDTTKNAASVTLTNKTLTSPVINSPTGIVKGDVGLGNVDNTSDAVKNAAAATLSNKTLAQPIIDILSLTEQSSTPATPSAGTKKFYAKNDGRIYTVNSSGSEVEVGSGSGSGVGARGFITNTDAELNTTGWVTYADAAGALPVDGTGGSPVSTWTRTTSTPLTGAASFLFTKGATNRQGDGVSYDFTISAADKAKVLKIEFDHMVDSGTFVAGSSTVDSDIEVYIYDVTNSVVIQPSSYKLFSNSSTIACRFSAVFQSSSNSTSYRLIFHVATTSASAYTVKFDNVNVTTSQYVYGSPVTDMKAYTPTFSAGFGTVTNINFVSWRVGNFGYISGTFTTGTVTTAAPTISLPAGWTVDSSITTLTAKGRMVRNVANQNTLTYALVNGGDTTMAFTDNVVAAANSPLVKSTNTSNWTQSTQNFSFTSDPIQIAGWGSSVQISSEGDGRIVAAQYSRTSTSSVTGSTAYVFDTLIKDTHGAYSTSTGQFTAPIPGFYRCSFSAYGGGGGNVDLNWYKNGSLFEHGATSLTNAVAHGSSTIYLNAGETLDVRPNAGLTPSAGGGGTVVSTNKISIERAPGALTISATETIAARYYVSANFTSSPTIPTNFDTKVHDTHGAVTTSATAWKFTAPAAGLYQVSGFWPVASSFYVYKNGSAFSIIGYNSGSYILNGSLDIYLNAGDYIDLRHGGSATVPGGLPASSINATYVNIKRNG